MKRFTTLALAAMFIFAISESKAQVPAGSFGLNAEFGFSAEELSLLYVLSSNLEIGLGIGYKSTTPSGDGEGDAVTEMGFNVYGAYYLSRGDVNPYITLYLGYFMPPTVGSGTSETTFSDIDIAAAFGGQVFITKNFAVYVEAGISFLMSSQTVKGPPEVTTGMNIMNLFTSAVGASLYF